MIDFLRSRDGEDVFKELSGSLLKEHGVNDFELEYMNIFKLGRDSNSHTIISKYSNPEVTIFIPDHEPLKPERRKINLSVKYSFSNIACAFSNNDLLIMVSDGKNHTYGFVGEVEGLHGEGLFLDTYWKKNGKGRFTTFAIGSSDRKKKVAETQPKGNTIIHRDNVGRWIVHFSNSTNFIEDFAEAIDNLELCFDGHFSNIKTKDTSHMTIINTIKLGWGTGVNSLISTLESLIDYSININEFYYQEDYTEESGEIRTIYKPSLIAIDNKFYLHKINE